MASPNAGCSPGGSAPDQLNRWTSCRGFTPLAHQADVQFSRIDGRAYLGLHGAWLDRIGLRQPRAVQTLREAASAPPDHPRWPVFLVLHGGGFREGDPTLYGFLADQYLERGIAFASVGYRLSPECSLPETFLDVENAVGWCIANLPSRGIDVARLALSGHSAGAIVTARLATRDNWQAPHGVPTDVIKAAVPVSGVYDFMDASERQELFRTVRTASRRARS